MSPYVRRGKLVAQLDLCMTRMESLHAAASASSFDAADTHIDQWGEPCSRNGNGVFCFVCQKARFDKQAAHKAEELLPDSLNGGRACADCYQQIVSKRGLDCLIEFDPWSDDACECSACGVELRPS